jgi:hypothetical protein
VGSIRKLDRKFRDLWIPRTLSGLKMQVFAPFESKTGQASSRACNIVTDSDCPYKKSGHAVFRLFDLRLGAGGFRITTSSRHWRMVDLMARRESRPQR